MKQVVNSSAKSVEQIKSVLSTVISLSLFTLFSLTLVGGIVGCARGASEVAAVTGYNEEGSRLTAKVAGSGEACPVTNSYFAARCEDSGLKVFNTSDCSVLCSGLVD